MKVLSLYCGAGGIDEGLKQAGIKTTLAVDVWKDACETFKLNHPETEVVNSKVSDIKDSLGEFDMVVGGPPCPEFSRAKTGRTLDPCEVNNFWGIVDNVKAKTWIMENVQDVIKVIKNKRNYLVNCADYGVPQTRIRRIFTNLPLPKPTHSKIPSSDLFGNEIKKWVSVKDALGLNGIIEDRKTKYFDETEYRRYSVDRPHHTLITDSRDFFISNSGHSTQNRENITRSVDEPSDTIVVASNVQITNYKIKSLKKIRNKNPIMYNKHLKDSGGACCSTITAKDRSTPSDMVTDGVYCRKLDNSELAILQGFKNYKWFGTKTSVRRQIGNAVPPPLIEAFANEMLTV